MILFVYGMDSWSAKEKIKNLKQSFLEKSGAILSSITEIEDFDIADFRNKVLSFGFFADKKMVIVRDLSDDKKVDEEAVIDILKKAPIEVSVLFYENGEPKLNSKLFKYLDSQKYKFSFPLLSGNALNIWIRERAKIYDCEIDNAVILYMIDILGSDLWKIDLELNKLCLYTIGYPVPNSKKVTFNTAKELLARSAEENIFKFLDALAVKNKNLALQLLKNELDAGTNELSLLGSIARQIRILLQTKYMLEIGKIDKAELAKELEIHPFVAQKALVQAQNFHINELKNIYRALLVIDIAIKTNSAPARVLFDRMIVKL